MEGTAENSTRPFSKKFTQAFRQTSLKLGDVSELAVLPKNKRSIKKKGTELRRTGTDVERADSTESLDDPRKRYFPFLILVLVFVQIGMMVFSKKYTWLTLCYDPFRRHEIWRYVTVLLVHSSLSHLLGNLLFEIILGMTLESVHGWKRVGGIFLSGVVAGSLAITVIQPTFYAVGASAGVYGLLSAHLATLIFNWAQMERKILRIFCLLAYIAFDVTLAILGGESNVSHSGHAGGAIAGFIAGVLILRNFEVLPWEKTFQKVVGGVGIFLVLGVVILNVSFPSRYLPTEFNFEYLDSYLKFVIQKCAESKVCSDLFLNQFNSTLPSV